MLVDQDLPVVNEENTDQLLGDADLAREVVRHRTRGIPSRLFDLITVDLDLVAALDGDDHCGR